MPALTGRIMALDVGKRRIGIALSDPIGITAQGLPTLSRTRIREDLDHLARIAEENGVYLILVGDPRHMSGDQSRQGDYTREFAERLSARTGLEVKYWDERLTSVQAERYLRESGTRIDRQTGAVDRIAAVILLESYLDSLERPSNA